MRFSIAVVLTVLALPLGAELTTSADPQAVLLPPSGAKIRLVNLWATWCQPCVIELMDLKLIRKDFSASELEIVGMSFDDVTRGGRDEKLERVRTFVERHRIPWRNIYFTGELSTAEEFFRFGGEIPLTVLYDSRGKELARFEGKFRREVLVEKIRTLLAPSD